MSSSSQNPARDAYIAGLRELADWLEQHPQVPATMADRETRTAMDGGAS